MPDKREGKESGEVGEAAPGRNIIIKLRIKREVSSLLPPPESLKELSTHGPSLYETSPNTKPGTT